MNTLRPMGKRAAQSRGGRYTIRNTAPCAASLHQPLALSALPSCPLDENGKQMGSKWEATRGNSTQPTAAEHPRKLLILSGFRKLRKVVESGWPTLTS